jgi:hypothetical protein
VSITGTDGGKSSTEDLPLVGCEAEVVTEEGVIKEIIVDENNPKSGTFSAQLFTTMFLRNMNS